MEFWQQWLAAITASGIGLGAVVMALSAWLGNVWSKRIETATNLKNDLEKLKEQSVIDKQARHDQAELNERMKDMEQKYIQLNAKDERFHQISQQTYQKLFDKKVEIYSQLMSISHSIEMSYPHIDLQLAEKIILEEDIGLEDKLLSARGLFANQQYKKFRELANENLALLSKDLFETYFFWEDEINIQARAGSDSFLKKMSKLMNEVNQKIQENPNQTNVELVSRVANISKIDLEHKKDLNMAFIYSNSFEPFEEVIKQLRKDMAIINKKIDSAIE